MHRQHVLPKLAFGLCKLSQRPLSFDYQNQISTLIGRDNKVRIEYVSRHRHDQSVSSSTLRRFRRGIPE
jgi:hypothetical protein